MESPLFFSSWVDFVIYQNLLRRSNLCGMSLFLRRVICVVWPLACSSDNCILHFYLSGDYFGCSGQANKCLLWTLNESMVGKNGELGKRHPEGKSGIFFVHRSKRNALKNLAASKTENIFPQPWIVRKEWGEREL